MKIKRTINLDLSIIECVNNYAIYLNKTDDELYNYFLRKGILAFLMNLGGKNENSKK